jgi:ADP-heptose:LPS heptosyltransferase
VGPGEESLGARVAAAARTRPAVLGAALDPVELGAAISLARVAVTNDSGPMHLAGAVGTPVAAFFGPTDPGRTGPSGSPSRVLDRYVFCSPCFKTECPYGHECMREISVEDAVRAVEELLGLERP